MYNEKWREAELIAKIREDFFQASDIDSTKYIGNIDFCVVQKPNLFARRQTLLWAEAKRGYTADNIKSLIQLILTIGKEKTHEKHLPPEFIAAFNARQIAFVEFNEIAEVFNQNDFNFNVAPNDHESKEFIQLYKALEKTLSKKSRVFDFFTPKDEFNPLLQRFIQKLRVRHGKATKIGITTNNFFKKPYFEWLQLVKPTINADFESPLVENIFAPSHNEFYLADLFADENSNQTLEKADLRLKLQGKHYILKLDESGKQNASFFFNDEQKAHKEFWEYYERPPKEQYWKQILKRRDLLAPQDKKEYQGAFFTPKIWTLKAKEYLENVFGKGFEKNYIIWDCAAGTGNLLEFFDKDAKNNIYASTLDEADVNIMLQRAKNEANFPLFESHIFKFDFLNDDFSTLPQTLQDILKDEKKRQKLIIFINPPYAEATSATTPTGTGKNKDGVSLGNKIYEKYKNILGKASKELFAQFFIRIQQEIPNCILASFSTLKYVNSVNFTEFRQTFKAEFKKGFVCPADTFDNVKGQFPIGFLIWDLNSKKDLKEIQLDIFNENGKFGGKKNFYANLNSQNINQWIKKFDDLSGEPKALMDTVGTDLQHSRYVKIVSPNFTIISHSIELHLTQKNIIPMSIYFAVRHAIEATWLNDRDQFLYPNEPSNTPSLRASKASVAIYKKGVNSKVDCHENPSGFSRNDEVGKEPLWWGNDTEFQNDCLAFTLFHSQNRI